MAIEIYYNNQLVSSATTYNYSVISALYAIDITGGRTSRVSILKGGSMNIFSGGVANSTAVNGGDLYIGNGGVANSTTVNSSGYLHIFSGGVANETTINSGTMYIESGGVANSTTVNGGYLYICSGGTATDVIWTPCVGYIDDAGGAYVTYASKYSGVYFGSRGQLLSHADTMTGEIVYGSMYVMSDGVANSTTVNSSGYLYISSGGVANSTAVNGGDLDIFSGGVANSTTVNSGGNMGICSGGVANSTTVNGGYLYIFSGGTATKITENGGYVAVADGANVTFASNTISGLTLRGAMTVHSNTVANSTTINSYGSMYISSGGVANSTTVNSDGQMYIYSGGVANSTTVNFSGHMLISSGGVANSTTVNYSGYIYVSSGGTASIVFNPWQGTVYSSAGAVVEYLEQDAKIYYGGWGSGIISKNDTMNGLQVTAGNSAIIYSGGTANSTTVSYYGRMFIFSGGVHRGSLQIASRATVSAYVGATVDFTIADRKTSDEYLINDLSLIEGTPTYTITVSADQEFGAYKLAQGASAFSDTITIGDGTENYGNITVNGEVISHNGVDYQLTQKSGDLTLSIGDLTPPELFVVGDTVTLTNRDVTLAVSANGECEILYQIDNGSWNTYVDGITVSANGTVNVKATDLAGNVTEKSIEVTNIDKDAPTLDLAADVTKPTNGNVVLTATVSDGTVEYYADGKWTAGDSLTVNANGTYQFRVTDAVGNVTEKSIVISNIDKVAPAIELSADITTPTNGNVVLTATVSDGIVEYYANGKWVTGESLTVEANGTYQFRVTDAAGNVTEKSVVINNIDKVAPDKPTASADITTATNGKVTVSAEFSSDSVVKEYSLNGKDWSTYEKGIDFLKNGKVYFRGQDAAGNYSDIVEYTVGNIDTDAPIAPIASADITTATNGKVTVSAEFSSDSVVKEYSLNGKDWSTYEKGIDFLKNGKIYFRGQDAAGNVSDVTSFIVDNIDTVADSISDKYVFISSRYTNKINGKKQNGITLIYGTNAFASLKAAGNTSDKTVILLDSKNSGDYVDQGVVAGTVVVPTVKETDNSYSYKANSAPKGTLNLVADTGSTEFIRFATVNVTGAAVGNITGGKESSTEDTKTAVDKEGTVTDTEKTSHTNNANGKFIALDGSAATVKGYTTVKLTGTAVTTLSGGNTKETFNSKLVDATAKDQKTISTVNDSVAAGSVTLQNESSAYTISGYSNVTLTDSIVGEISNFTSKGSKSESATYDEARNTVTRKVTLSHTETTAGTLKATNVTEIGNVTGFVTVTLKNVEQSGDFCRKDADDDDYSTVKETLNIKTNKDGSLTGTYSKTETFTRAGKFTATGSVVGDIENFSNVTLDGSAAGAVSNFETAKIVTSGTALWSDMYDYGRPEDYDLNLDAMDLKVTETKSLNGSVTLKNHAYAESIESFQSVTMTGSDVGTISNVTKVTVNKGDSSIGSYIGTDGNDTLNIAKDAVLTANQIDLGEEVKDTLAINGTLILTGTEVNAFKITGKGEIAAVSEVFADLDVAFANTLDVGETSENFRGTAYEKADDTLKKAVKWDGATEYDGWLGVWSGYTSGSDDVDYIKFKAVAGDELIVSGIDEENWTLFDSKGNLVKSKYIFADNEFKIAGEYIIKLENDADESIAYSIALA